MGSLGGGWTTCAALALVQVRNPLLSLIMLTALAIHYTFASWALLLPVVFMKAFDAMAQALLDLMRSRVGSFEVISGDRELNSRVLSLG